MDEKKKVKLLKEVAKLYAQPDTQLEDGVDITIFEKVAKLIAKDKKLEELFNKYIEDYTKEFEKKEKEDNDSRDDPD